MNTIYDNKVEINIAIFVHRLRPGSMKRSSANPISNWHQTSASWNMIHAIFCYYSNSIWRLMHEYEICGLYTKHVFLRCTMRIALFYWNLFRWITLITHDVIIASYPYNCYNRLILNIMNDFTYQIHKRWRCKMNASRKQECNQLNVNCVNKISLSICIVLSF